MKWYMCDRHVNVSLQTAEDSHVFGQRTWSRGQSRDQSREGLNQSRGHINQSNHIDQSREGSNQSIKSHPSHQITFITPNPSHSSIKPIKPHPSHQIHHIHPSNHIHHIHPSNYTHPSNHTQSHPITSIPTHTHPSIHQHSTYPPRLHDLFKRQAAHFGLAMLVLFCFDGDFFHHSNTFLQLHHVLKQLQGIDSGGRRTR